MSIWNWAWVGVNKKPDPAKETLPIATPPPVVIEKVVQTLVPDPVRMAKPLKTRYLNVVFQGSVFPDDPYRNVPINFNDSMKSIYIPEIEKTLPNEKQGLRCLMIAMTHQEGFYKGSRSYRYNNPGNIGNTDSGANRGFKTLADGIRAQADHLKDIADGAKHYPLGTKLYLPPFYSKEIANNPQYGLPENLPGYRFTYTGQLDQFLKIYSTGARATNNYLDVIVSYFKLKGLKIYPDSTIMEIISM